MFKQEISFERFVSNMFGLARTTSFMLNSAEVMLGPEVALFSLNSEHSLGLVKEFSLSLTPQTLDLPSGPRAMPAAVARKGNTLSADMQLYEYTAKNLSYASSLNAPQQTSGFALIDEDVAETATTFSVTNSDVFAAEDVIIIKQRGIVITRVVEQVSALKLTLTESVGVNLKAGAIVMRASVINLGGASTSPTLSARVVSTLTDGTPVELQLPRVVPGGDLSLTFSPESFSSLPFNLRCLECRPGDPNYSVFGRVPGRLILGSHNDSVATVGLGTEFWDNLTTWDNSKLWN